MFSTGLDLYLGFFFLPPHPPTLQEQYSVLKTAHMEDRKGVF